MFEERTMKEQYQENIKLCFEPDLDLKQCLIALIKNDTAMIDRMKNYIEQCEAERDSTLQRIENLEDEQEILGVVGRLEAVKRDG